MGQLGKNEIAKRERVFLKSLSPLKKQKLNKLYPYREIRNRELRLLWHQGVSQVLLRRVSGLSESHLFRIIHRQTKGRR
jgi:HD superfamily phosphohydrolase YqeK